MFKIRAKPRNPATINRKSILDRDFYHNKMMIDSDQQVYLLKYDGDDNYSAFRQDGISFVTGNISFKYILEHMKQPTIVS